MLLGERVQGLLRSGVAIVMWRNGEGKQGSGYISVGLGCISKTLPCSHG